MIEKISTIISRSLMKLIVTLPSNTNRILEEAARAKLFLINLQLH